MTINAQNAEQPIITGTFSDSITQSNWFSEWLKINGESIINVNDANELKTLLSEDVFFKIYLGTWCEDSQVYVPVLLDLIEGSNCKFEIIGVNREKECPFKPKECKSWDIEFVPTIKVFRNDKELGRIIEAPKESISKDLIDLLRQDK